MKTKSILLLFTLLICLCKISTAQFTFNKQIGSTGSDYIKDVTSDGALVTYICGSFVGTITLGATNLTSFGGADYFIAKLDANGNYIWAKKIGGTGNENSYAQIFHYNTNIYITGVFPTGTINVLGTNVTTALSSDCFLAQVNSSGTLVWVTKTNGYPVRGLAVASHGIYAVNGGGVAKFNHGSGILAWQINYTFTPPAGWWSYFNISYDVAADNTDGVYVAGGFSLEQQTQTGTGTAYFPSAPGSGGGTFSFTIPVWTIPSQETDISLVKYNSLGVAQWARQMGTTHDNSPYWATDQPSRICYNSNQNSIYLTGAFTGSTTYPANFGGFTRVPLGNNWTDIFTTKISTTGTTAWVSQLGSNNNVEYGGGITSDNTGNVYITGLYTTLTLNTNQVTSGCYITTSSHFPTGLLVVKYNSSGVSQWLTNTEGATSNGNVTCDNIGNAYVSQDFTNTIYPGLLSFSASATDALYSKVKVSGANAGPDKHVGACCTSTQIGTPGMANCTYSWTPTTYLTPPYTTPQIMCNLGQASITYTLTCTSNGGCITTDQVTVDMTGIICCRFGEMHSEDENTSSAIQIYPNPNSGIFTIAGSGIKGRIDIYNDLGVQVYSQILDEEQDNIKINLEKYNNGIYLVRVSTDDNSFFTKFFKQ